VKMSEQPQPQRMQQTMPEDGAGWHPPPERSRDGSQTWVRAVVSIPTAAPLSIIPGASEPSSLPTLRWREMDSNFQFRAFLSLRTW